MQPDSKVNLFGASGHGKVILDILVAQGKKVECIYDDAPRCDRLHGVPVIKPDSFNLQSPLIISIGNNLTRKLLSTKYDVSFEKAIHPQAIISPTVRIGNGSVVMQGASIQSDATIGNHCIINSGASIDHECVIHDYVHVSPHATLCGNVEVEEGTWIGAGATVIPGIKIGKWCTVGAGAVVIRDIDDYTTVVGNPAKPIKKSEFPEAPELGGGNLFTFSGLVA